MSRILSVLVALLIAAGVTAYIVYQHFPRVQKVVGYEQVQVDESVWVRRSTVESDRDLMRRLKKDNAELAAQVKDAQQYIRINAYLRTQIDSLIAAVPLPVDSLWIRDTTIVFTAVAGDSLFLVQSRNVFNNNELTDYLTLTQLRPVVVDVVMDGTAVYVSSPDFTELNFKTYTSTKPPRLRWYHWLGAGLLGGVVIWETIR
jgi:hypothetical protein